MAILFAIPAQRVTCIARFVDIPSDEDEPMSEQPLFQSSEVVVTSSQLVYHGKHYPFHMIKSVVFVKEPFDVKGLLINAVIAVVGLLGILSFKSAGVIVGLLAVAICGFNLYNDFKEIQSPTFIVAVELHSGESEYIKRRDKEWVLKLHDVLRAAMMR